MTKNVYVLQKWFTPPYRKKGSWTDFIIRSTRLVLDKDYNTIKSNNSLIKLRIVKRTITDEVVK